MISPALLPVAPIPASPAGTVGAPQAGDAGRPAGEFARALDEAGAAHDRPPAKAVEAPKDARPAAEREPAPAPATAGTPAPEATAAGARPTRAARPAPAHAPAKPSLPAPTTSTRNAAPHAAEDAAPAHEPRPDKGAATETAGGAPDAAPTAGDDTAALLAALRTLRPLRSGTPGDTDRAPARGGRPVVVSVAGARPRPAEARVSPDAPPPGSAEASRAAPAQAFGEALVAAGAPEAKVTRTESASAPGTAPIGGLAAPPSVLAGAGVAVAEGRLAATPGSAEFAHQLGAQVTTFVRDGVQHARLQLHPAELGPVTVQIQLDGQAAKIIFSAENPFTRQALEQSMPQLAGSLREAGLTLSGGGVFEQPRQPGDGAPDRSPGGLAGHGAGDEAGVENVLRPAAPAPRRRGVVDLVA